MDKIDWPERIKIAQRNWIGKSEGALINFPIHNSKFQIPVFTTRPDTLFGATYLVLAPEHEMIPSLKPQILNLREVEEYIQKAKSKPQEERIVEGKEKTGVELKGVGVINPATKREVPIWVADYVLGAVGTGAIMAVPAHDRRDFEFAQKYNLPTKIVVCPNYPEKTCPVLTEAYERGGHLVDSGQFDGMPSEKAKDEITKFVGGQKQVHYRLRDWLISRQRYWGPPIPMIFCEKCVSLNKGEMARMPGWYSVSEKDLPVRLPYVKNFRPTGTEKSPLAAIGKFHKVRCPGCKTMARRETDVSDTFLDSAWYYLRYPSCREKNRPWNAGITKKWFPADMYIGGAEHAVLHLLYVRFLAMALHDMGILDFSAKGGSASGGEEPFKKFRAHGLLIRDGAKMSKSRGNVINPDEYIKKYGADALRMCLMFLGPFERGGDFRDAGIRGITRFLDRAWILCSSTHGKLRTDKRIRKVVKDPLIVDRLLNRTVKKVTEDIENLQYNTAISALMILLNNFEENAATITQKHIEVFLKLLAPFAPHITEELWHVADRKNSIHGEPWPNYNPKLITEETITLVIQINGKTRSTLQARQGLSEVEFKEMAVSAPLVKKWLEGKTIRKVIFVPDRLINFVA